eukprot:CAMPEP_0202968658 /NCGR_PEP_ID=MMETSP1396-20130829/14034_1 /ASSEMBLY_ACC=CAM_ASM_000872 /TAXON_ID= /ORGANISM="Pseudokeronopsis sp., Strain Brazil" /LENGTH=40 /DNA_ID= /DNA_START= /DNA_END= /DNA_ORIENTATION=
MEINIQDMNLEESKEPGKGHENRELEKYVMKLRLKHLEKE